METQCVSGTTLLGGHAEIDRYACVQYRDAVEAARKRL